MTEPSPRIDHDADWENLLLRWRSQPNAHPRPFFYQRVRARLAGDDPARRPPLPAWLRRPAYAALLGLLGVALSGDCAVLPATRSAAPQGQPASRPPGAVAR